MTAGDWSSVAEIYRQGIVTGNATFQQEIPTWEAWDSGHIKSCRIVAEFENEIIGLDCFKCRFWPLCLCRGC